MRKLILSFVFLASACGATEQALEFTEFSEESFLAACTQTGEDISLDQRASDIDSDLVSDICGCVWDTTSSEMSFAEFESLDDLLTQDPNTDLPIGCLLYTSPSPRDQRGSRMPSSA